MPGINLPFMLYILFFSLFIHISGQDRLELEAMHTVEKC